MQELRIIMDQRERNPELITTLASKGIDVDVQTIPVGDYILSDRVCVERKTVPDFESSIINGRLFDQIERLMEGYEFPILILEGSLEDLRLGSNVINGAIVSLYLNYKMLVLFSHGPNHTAEMMASIAKQERDGKREPSVKGSFRAHTDSQLQEYVVGNLPGIGPKLARSLLRHFKSIKNIANANVEELMDVEKIGKKKAERIHLTFNKAYREGK